MGFTRVLALLGFGIGLSACGESLPEQAAIGAAAGAAGAVVVSGSVVTGAVVGAAGNALYCQTYPSRCR